MGPPFSPDCCCTEHIVVPVVFASGGSRGIAAAVVAGSSLVVGAHGRTWMRLTIVFGKKWATGFWRGVAAMMTEQSGCTPSQAAAVHLLEYVGTGVPDAGVVGWTRAERGACLFFGDHWLPRADATKTPGLQRSRTGDRGAFAFSSLQQHSDHSMHRPDLAWASLSWSHILLRPLSGCSMLVARHRLSIRLTFPPPQRAAGRCRAGFRAFACTWPSRGGKRAQRPPQRGLKLQNHQARPLLATQHGKRPSKRAASDWPGPVLSDGAQQLSSSGFIWCQEIGTAPSRQPYPYRVFYTIISACHAKITKMPWLPHWR